MCPTMLNLKKRSFKPDDPFFEQGSVLCRLLRESFIPINSASNGELGMEQDTHEIDCQIQGCYRHFSSLCGYEQHYATRHRIVCQSCNKALPTQYLLDVHINELHNPMFDILSRNSPLYACLVYGCTQTFPTSKARKKHLVQVHKYPSSFRFERLTSSKCKQPVTTKGHQMKAAVNMDTSPECNAAVSPQSRFKYSYKVPASLSFGQGVQKAFNRRRRAKGNHLTKSSVISQEVNIEDVDMNDLSEALGS